MTMPTVQAGDIAEALAEAALEGGEFDCTVARRIHDRDSVEFRSPHLTAATTREEMGDTEQDGVEVWLANGQRFRVIVEAIS